jgi:hypothetical protein
VPTVVATRWGVYALTAGAAGFLKFGPTAQLTTNSKGSSATDGFATRFEFDVE